ncbi:hypothetical protein M3Y99_01742400 [Aphelenchoides fujianensis]|nr:hypothetical protein M3Y99_01742400 [Aphelenchoides fujianensis]
METSVENGTPDVYQPLYVGPAYLRREEAEANATRRKGRSILNYLFIFHALQVILMFAGVANLLFYAHFYYGVYAIFFAFCVYVAAYHSFRNKYRWLLIVYFITEGLFIVWNVALAFLMFAWSAHSINIGDLLHDVPERIAEAIAILQMLLVPCQLVSIFIMVRNFQGHELAEFIPKSERERYWIFTMLGAVFFLTLVSLAFTQYVTF